jgi:hypothetical protein
MADEEGSYGHYVGDLILRPLADGRLMELVQPYEFVNDDGMGWPVPSGVRVDGASIPQVLWSFIGGPFEGRYRNASVVHDYYCDARIRPWRSVHRVFYNAMRASGVAEYMAKVMFAAVYFAGPRWSDTTSHNNNVPRPNFKMLTKKAWTPLEVTILESIQVQERSAQEILDSGTEPQPSDDEIKLRFDQIRKYIEAQSPSLSDIERAMDESASVVEPNELRLGARIRTLTLN